MISSYADASLFVCLSLYVIVIVILLASGIQTWRMYEILMRERYKRTEIFSR
jgi:hypothetical protein